MEEHSENQTQFISFEQVSQELMNIAAISPAEFRRKLDRIICGFMLQNHAEFKGGTYVEEDDDSLAELKIKLSGFSYHGEILTAANVFSWIAEIAYKKDLGLLHRNLARVAITLAITAAEDYANLICLHEKSMTEQNLRKMSLHSKWTLLVPQLAAQLADFKGCIDLRNDMIIHLKKQADLPLDFITEINYENAVKAIRTVQDMIYTHSNGMTNLFTDQSCRSLFLQLITAILQLVTDQEKQMADAPRS